MLQVPELVTGRHVQLVVTLGGEEAGAELTQHCAGVLEAVHQLALVQTSLHLESLDFHYTKSFIKKLILIISHDESSAIKHSLFISYQNRTELGIIHCFSSVFSSLWAPTAAYWSPVSESVSPLSGACRHKMADDWFVCSYRTRPPWSPGRCNGQVHP